MGGITSMRLTFGSRLNRADATYYFMGKLRHANVGVTSLAVANETPSFAMILEKWRNAADRVGRLRQVLRPTPLDLTAPSWVFAREFNINEHVRHIDLAPQRSQAALLRLVDEIQSQSFDYAKPLWSYTFVSGLEGGRAAGILRLHHCLSDGASLLAIFGNVSMSIASGNGVGIVVETAEDAEGTLPHAIKEIGTSIRDVVWNLGSFRVLASRAANRQLARDLRRYLLPLPDRGGTPSTQRRAILCRLPLQAWQEAAKARGAGVNELYLAVVAAAWNGYASAIGLSKRNHVRVAMPVDLREGDQQQGGNVLGVGIVECEGGKEELADLTRLRDEAARAKLVENATGSRTLASVLALVPGRVAGPLLFHHSAFPDTVASKLGIPVTLDIGGVPIERLYMLLSVIGSPFACGLFIYNENAHLSFNCDVGYVTDLHLLAVAINDVLGRVFGETEVSLVTSATEEVIL